jgi:hypothetical protein
MHLLLAAAGGEKKKKKRGGNGKTIPGPLAPLMKRRGRKQTSGNAPKPPCLHPAYMVRMTRQFGLEFRRNNQN